ncbi:hypothetical protein ACWJKU_06505 [Methylocaldum sp. MU1018]
MNQSEPTGFLQHLASYAFQSGSTAIMAVAVFLALVIGYVFFRRRRSVVADLPKAPAAEAPPGNIPRGSGIRRNVAVADEEPANPPKSSAAGTPRHNVPEDSVLRRHYVSHIGYMIETVTFPRPTDSVLCRHYDHLIASELESCLSDGARMEKLISRYEERRRNTKD